MKYSLVENYYVTNLFQEILQTYFDTVLKEILQKHSIIEAKGLFVKNNKVLKDCFDIPYHIHILNGLGTRGVMLGPYLANQLFQYIENKIPLEREIDIKLYNKYVNTLNDPKADKFAKATAQLMLKKYQDKIGQIGFLQESNPEIA